MKRQDGYLTKESGAWLGHYSHWITDYSTGQRKRRQRAFKIGPVSMKKTQARNKLRERIVSELGITVDSKVTLGWFIEHRWLPFHVGSWRDSTKAVNRELLKFILGRFGATPIENMDGVAMQVWLTGLAKEKSGSLVRHCHNFLCSILTQATDEEYCRKNPTRLMSIPKLKKPDETYLQVDEVRSLLKAAMWYPRERTLLTIIFVCPFRPSELFALKWKCFDGKRCTLTIAETIYRGQVRPFTKTTEEGEKDHVTVYLPEAAVNALMKWHSESERNGPDDYIFPNRDGGWITKENYQKRVLTPLAKMAGIEKLNFQILRRTVATHAQHLGSPKDIASIMRHKKVETAQLHYIKMIEQTVKDTAERLAQKMLTR
jgi:integrase